MSKKEEGEQQLFFVIDDLMDAPKWVRKHSDIAAPGDHQTLYVYGTADRFRYTYMSITAKADYVEKYLKIGYDESEVTSKLEVPKWVK